MMELSDRGLVRVSGADAGTFLQGLVTNDVLALPKGLTLAQFTVLNHFVRLKIEDKSPAALANAFQLTRATMTSTLGRLERAGLIAVRRDPQDGRAKRVSITEAGRAMRDRCIEAIAPLAPHVALAVPESDFVAILPLLRRMRIALDALRNT